MRKKNQKCTNLKKSYRKQLQHTLESGKTLKVENSEQNVSAVKAHWRGQFGTAFLQSENAARIRYFIHDGALQIGRVNEP